MNYKEIEKELRRIKNNPKGWENKYSSEDFEPTMLNGKVLFESSIMEDDQYQINYLGTFMSLDPCGKYHHVLSPNGITKRCENFWNNIEKACNKLGLWIEPGEGDFCDIFLCKNN